STAWRDVIRHCLLDRMYARTSNRITRGSAGCWTSGSSARRRHPSSLLVVDEIGYLPISHPSAVLFLQLMNRRDEPASTVLTSNKGFEKWGEVFSDEVMAAALIDRVLPPGQHSRQ